ncbi:Ku protein [Solwaraspora sp. WMMD406]|uniref:non-homologous end joining protein Ku n=1 Tax=Solwaraspora sp. WMMD406 TaxID=3016095 RepID=UPI002417D720|nr:Ku protein [Solwaraspora sp. WMMD406]MDG4763457.1 Ku protein [Solwaraspora sp. WMMD406]
MRAIWKGAVSFGLVSIGVRLYSATEEKDIRFHQVHREDGGRIRYKRVCSVDGEEVSYDDIAKGYDLGGGEMVILTDEDFADLPLSTSRAIDVLQFVPADQVDPMLYNKAYYLEPEGTATKPYVLLRDALADSDRVAIVKVAIRQREQLATLRVRDNVLVLNTMLWPDEIRQASFGFLDDDIQVRPPELAMAASLIDSMAGEFAPDEYTDDYRTALQEVIDAKVEGREIVAPEEEEEAPAAAVDLMAALRASVERARVARGESADGDGDHRAADADREPAEPTPITSAKSAKSAKAAAPAPTEKKAAPAKKTGQPAQKKTTAKKAAPAKQDAPAKKTASDDGKQPAAKKTGQARKSTDAQKKTTARKTAAKKTTARKTAAKKTTERKTA